MAAAAAAAPISNSCARILPRTRSRESFAASLSSRNPSISAPLLHGRERRILASSPPLGRREWGIGPAPPIASMKGVVCASASPPSSSTALPEALLFDCDGVLVDTEKDGHRISFNETFAERELGVTWDVELYGELLKIGGGKERLIDEALAKAVKVAVCSTSNEKAVSAIVSFLLGPERAEKITIFAGDVVPRKKPDPAIYLLAANTLNVEPSRCIVVEDSAIGLAAAKAAGMKCIITKSGYTAEEDFVTADAVFDCIGDPPEERFDLDFCANLLQKQYVS